MFLAVLGVMQKYNAAWSGMSAIADMVTRLSNYANGIQQKTGVQGSPLSGIAGGKRRKRVEMMERAITIAGDLHALAIKNNDANLEAKTAVEITDLVRLGDSEIGPRCQEICALAQANAASLAAFGVSAADIAALQTAINDFTPLITKPREAVVGRKAVTEDISNDENAADQLLRKELDPAMRKFKTKEPALFSEYASARMIVDLGERHERPPEPTPAPGTTPPQPV